MDEVQFRKLDTAILKRLCEKSTISAEDLSSLCFLLFSTIKPKRITAACFFENKVTTHDSYGTANSPIVNIEQFKDTISSFTAEPYGLYTIQKKTDCSALLPDTGYLGVANFSYKASSLLITIELEDEPQYITSWTSFLERLASYLQIFHEKLKYQKEKKHCKAIKQSFRDLPAQALLVDEHLAITCISDAFKFRTPADQTLREGMCVAHLLKEADRDELARIALESASLHRETAMRASLFDGIGWKRIEILIRPAGNKMLTMQFDSAGSSAQTQSFENQQLALFTTLNPFPVVQFDATGKILSANPSAMRTFGIDVDADIFLTLFVPQYTLPDLKACIENGSIISKTSIVKKKTFQFVARGAPGLGYGLLYGIDITDRVKAEKQLADSHTFLRNIIDANPNLIFVKDADGRFTLANQAVADVYGTTIENLIGKSDSDFNDNSAEIEHFRKDDLEVIHHQRTLSIKEEAVTDAAGNIRWLQTVKKPLRTIDDTIRVLGVASDITEHKRLQMQLLQSQKMEAVGQLAGGIAHDFNNLLTGILGYTNLLLSEEGASKNIQHPAQMIEKAALQASQLTQKLLGFARKGKHQNIAVDMHDAILETTALLKRTVEENITLNLALNAPSAHVQGDPIQIQQIIMNLVLNARDAIQSSDKKIGRIDISTKRISTGQTTQYEEAQLGPREYLLVSLKDSGCGISDENIGKIFDPFFSTKDPSKGTGMGLAMVYGIVDNHGGSITVKSVEGEGSEFQLFLPVASTIEDRVTKIRGKSVKGRGQILLVDDHSMILDVTTQMLTNLGYEVVTAKDGVQALTYYQDNADKIDLVILDMIMPRMGARECFQRFQSINPEVRVILSTGYVNNNKVQEILNEGMTGFVQKPYHLHELSKVVADALRTEH